VEIAEDLKVTCGLGTLYAYELGSKSRVEFSLSDDGAITNPHAVPLTDGTDGRKLVQPAACAQTGCSWSFATNFTVLKIDPGSLGGGLDDNEGTLNVTASWVSTATPAVTLSCPEAPPKTDPEIPGRLDHFGPVPLGPKGDTHASPSGLTTFCVRPKDIPCGI
jgi:hypothetical protein